MEKRVDITDELIASLEEAADITAGNKERIPKRGQLADQGG